MLLCSSGIGLVRIQWSSHTYSLKSDDGFAPRIRADLEAIFSVAPFFRYQFLRAPDHPNVESHHSDQVALKPTASR